MLLRLCSWDNLHQNTWGPCQKQHLRPEEPPKNGAGGAQVFVFVKQALQVILIRTGVWELLFLMTPFSIWGLCPQPSRQGRGTVSGLLGVLCMVLWSLANLVGTVAFGLHFPPDSYLSWLCFTSHLSSAVAGLWGSPFFNHMLDSVLPPYWTILILSLFLGFRVLLILPFTASEARRSLPDFRMIGNSGKIRLRTYFLSLPSVPSSLLQAGDATLPRDLVFCLTPLLWSQEGLLVRFCLVF